MHAYSTYTFKLPSSFSGFRSKSTTYGALANGLLQFLRKIKCAVKFASEQQKREAG